MTSGPAKRPRRSSVEEGPTIYKCDQLRQMLETALRNRSKRHANTDPVKFLGGYLPVRTESNGKSRSRGGEDENPSTARFHSFCKQLAEALGVSKDFIVERLTHALLHDESQLKELCDHLSAATEHYDLAMSLLKDEPLNRPVTIRIGTTNLINMRVLPAVLEAVRQRFREAWPNVPLRFTQTILDSEELLFGNQPLVGVDAIIACCLKGRTGKIPSAEVVARLPLRCCLLRTRLETSSAQGPRSLANWEELRNTEMVALSTRRKHFDIPWSDIESSVESIEEVPTLLEAHARVAASDAWTLSYRELMDDVDEQRFEVLDLPPDSERQSPLIVAVMPRVRGAAANPDAAENGIGVEKRAALTMFKECLQVAFEQKQQIQHAALELTQWLARFPYSYHLSDCAGEKGERVRRMWFAGRAQLDCTSNGNLTGVITLASPQAEPAHVRVFGRPLSYHQGTVWHLQWRSVDQRAESGTTNLVVSKADLEQGSVLVGSWVGRSSWMAEEVCPSGGPFLLHTQSGLTPRELRRLMAQHQDRSVPDLRQLSNELISLEPVPPHADSELETDPQQQVGPAKPR